VTQINYMARLIAPWGSISPMNLTKEPICVVAHSRVWPAWPS
jgi:hypothetical protein